MWPEHLLLQHHPLAITEACNQEVHLEHHHHYLNILLEMEVLGLIKDRCIAVSLMLQAQPLPTSAGVSEPSLYQHSNAPPHYQWAAGSTAGASTSLSNAGAFPAMAVNTGSGAPHAPDGSGGMGSLPNTQPHTQPRMEQPISKNKSPLPKLSIKGGDPTTLTRIINEWVQKTAIALNTWSLEASNFWNQSVNPARQQHNWWLSLAPQDRATRIGLPASFQALPTQVPVLEATMRAELINSVLPEKVTSMAMQKGALKVHELLFLTFQAFLPSEPSALVDGLNTVETPLKAARNFAEALTTLRTWRQQVVTVVTDLKANPEPLKLFSSLKILISNLTSSDNAFATEVSQMYRSTQIKATCIDKALLDFMGLLEIEMSNRAMEDDEDRRRRGQANMAASSSQSPPEAAANAVGKGGKMGKGKPKGGGKGEKRTVCQEYLTDKGCPKGDQCPHAHPRKTGKCLRCGATGHDLASCRRPAKDPKKKGSPPPPKGQGRGKGKAKAKPKPKAKAQAHESTAQPAGANAAWALEEDAGYGDVYEELNYVTPTSACSFYTTFLPTFHASVEDHPENLPILDTGATHCLLVTCLGAEECEKAEDSPQSGNRHHCESFAVQQCDICKERRPSSH